MRQFSPKSKFFRRIISQSILCGFIFIVSVSGLFENLWAYEQDLKKLSKEAIGFWEDPLTGMAFVWIAGGCFQMGNRVNNDTWAIHEKPVHNVCMDGFWMGKFEVTNAQFRKFQPDHHSRNYRTESMDQKNQPVTGVTWKDAKHFAKWLTEQNKGKYLFRLPTEAEWEHACRANTSTARYWGDASEEACKYGNVADRTMANEAIEFHHCDDGFLGTAPVGSFRPNDFGLYDMLGNVWEWCEDVYGKEAYKFHRSKGEKNPIYKVLEIGVDLRVIRGGSWQSRPDAVRCANRKYNPPDGKFDVLGFRLVMVPLSGKN